MQFCIYSVHREIYILSILREIEKERKRRHKKRERGGKRSPEKIGVGGFFSPCFMRIIIRGNGGGGGLKGEGVVARALFFNPF